MKRVDCKVEMQILKSDVPYDEHMPKHARVYGEMTVALNEEKAVWDAIEQLNMFFATISLPGPICPVCKHSISVNASFQGRRTRCGYCSSIFTVKLDGADLLYLSLCEQDSDFSEDAGNEQFGLEKGSDEPEPVVGADRDPQQEDNVKDRGALDLFHIELQETKPSVQSEIDAHAQARKLFDSWEKAGGSGGTMIPVPFERVVTDLGKMFLSEKRLGDGKDAPRAALYPVVGVFADVINKRLLANDHKGGWSKCSTAWLLSKLLEECGELAAHVQENLIGGDVGRGIVNEAADIAAIAMMIADNLYGVMRDSDEQKE